MSKFSIRRESVKDIPSIRDIHNLAFENEGERQLVDDLRAADQIAVSLIAEQEGRIISHVLWSRIDGPMRALALGPVAVHPGAQRQGVGSALIREGMRQAQAEGWEAVFVYGAPSYYSRFGFDVDAAKGFVCPYSGRHFMVQRLKQDLPEQGQLTYPAPWAALG